MKLTSLIPAIAVTGLILACNSTDKQDKISTADTSRALIETDRPETPVNTMVKPEEIPVVSRTHFEAKYPQASQVVWNRYVTISDPMNVDWEWYGWPAMDNNDYMVQFSMNDYPYWVWYDENGNWVGSVETITAAGVPDAVNTTLRSQFEGYAVESVKKENDKDRVAYEIRVAKGDDKWRLLIDENGKIMKKKGNVEGDKTKEKNF
jgi:hypothetical protein